MMENRNAITIEELAGLLGMSYGHMTKLVENDRLARGDGTTPVPFRNSRPLPRRKRLDQRAGLAI